MKSPFDITNRQALIMGGTSGLGREIALGFARAGCNTIATGRRQAETDSVTSEIQNLGVQTFSCPCDATNLDSLNNLKSQITSLDILIYAAGKTLKKPTEEITPEEWADVQNVNTAAALRTCQTFLLLLKQSQSPRIITIASLSSFAAFYQVAAYSASKAALLSLTQSLAVEWGKHGIRSNAIVPGVFVTDLNRKLLNGTARGQELLTRTPLNRFGNAEELVGAALFLASDAASFINGIALPVDGGFLASGVNQ